MQVPDSPGSLPSDQLYSLISFEVSTSPPKCQLEVVTPRDASREVAWLLPASTWLPKGELLGQNPYSKYSADSWLWRRQPPGHG